jgi:hypothetical protein
VTGRQRQTGRQVQAGIYGQASASRQAESGAGIQVQGETGKGRGWQARQSVKVRGKNRHG